ncbi:ABC transporter permease [Marinobacterium sediminicola]|uniref:Peptide/nickel transport system permease protein n=1 Tax=Marinobacterium sediminicola TaxID=518898 RepID=A0ABY1RYK5_9GAMM|nr:ABC transporter permease [Marinobacterium sediminicola]ULG68084.1 ABC transporter permease [Marinobacterium sediminicola]SMR73404.1 peptide/nickel transport system permease protein [Marinobacterium sediminicola]
MQAFLTNTWLLWLLSGTAALLWWRGRSSQLFYYIFNRYLLALGTLLLVSGIVFSLMEVLPGDCAEKMIAYKNTQGEVITQAQIDAERARMGLDQPLPVRWASWVADLTLKGDLGFSCAKRQSVNMALGDRFWMSLGFCIAGLLFAYLIAVPFGILSAWSLNKPWLDRKRHHTPLRRLRNSIGLVIAKLVDLQLRLISYLGLALPNFLLALSIILLYVFAGEPTPTGLFSDEWRGQPWFAEQGFQWGKLNDFMGHIWLPILVIGWAATALQLQTVRALVVDESNKLYVEAARARGIDGFRLWSRYPVRHSISPLFNSVGFDFQRIFNDLPIVAVVIGLTDAAALLIEALAMTNDQELAAGILFLVALVVIGMNFITDVILAVLDPRVRNSVMQAGGH